MRQTLPQALELMFGHEGGYVNVATDRGGPTKYGITHKTLAASRGVASVTAEQVRNMTQEEAAKIYETSYWGQSGGDLLPVGLDYMAFDFGVNSGPARAIKELQGVLGITADGVVGVQTVNAVMRYPKGLMALLDDYTAARMRFLKGLGGKTGFSKNGRGWTIRVTGVDPKGEWKTQPGVIGNARKLAAGSTPVITLSPDEGLAKSSDSDKSLIETLKKPEAWAPLGTLLGTVGTLFTGSGPLQWALAGAVVIGIGYGVWRVVKRERSGG